MKTKVLLALATLLLQGCFYQKTSMEDINKAQEYCKDGGGLYEIKVDFAGNEYAYCVDRTYPTSPSLGSLKGEIE